MAVTFLDRKSAQEHALFLKEQGIGTKIIRTSGGKLQVIRTGFVPTIARGAKREVGALILEAEPIKVATPIVKSVSRKVNPYLRRKQDYKLALGTSPRAKHPRINLGIPFITPKVKLMPGSIGSKVRYKNIGRIKTTQKDIADIKTRTREL